MAHRRVRVAAACLLFMAGCTQITTTSDGGDAGRPEANAGEMAKRLVGRWKHSQGESWAFYTFREDGTYRHSQHHDGAGGDKGYHTDGKYKVLAGSVIEFTPDKGEAFRYTADLDGNELLLKPDGGRWMRQ